MLHHTINTIEWSSAIVINKHIQESKIIQQEQDKEEQAQYLQDFLDSDFSMLDSADIHYYAEQTGKTANELRRMHPNKNEYNVVESFMGDDTDDIIDFY